MPSIAALSLNTKVSSLLPPVRFSIFSKVKPLGYSSILPLPIPVIFQVELRLGPTRVEPPAIITGALKLAPSFRVTIPVPSEIPISIDSNPSAIACSSVSFKSKPEVMPDPPSSIFWSIVPGCTSNLPVPCIESTEPKLIASPVTVKFLVFTVPLISTNPLPASKSISPPFPFADVVLRWPTIIFPPKLISFMLPPLSGAEVSILLTAIRSPKIFISLPGARISSSGFIRKFPWPLRSASALKAIAPSPAANSKVLSLKFSIVISLVASRIRFASCAKDSKVSS